MTLVTALWGDGHWELEPDLPLRSHSLCLLLPPALPGTFQMTDVTMSVTAAGGLSPARHQTRVRPGNSLSGPLGAAPRGCAEFARVSSYAPGAVTSVKREVWGGQARRGHLGSWKRLGGRLGHWGAWHKALRCSAGSAASQGPTRVLGCQTVHSDSDRSPSLRGLQAPS